MEEKHMNKAELIDAISSGAGIGKSDAGSALDATLDAISCALKSGDKVAIAGFGTFSVSDRAARVGRNPRTGEPIQIAASRLPKFKAGAKLKAAV